MKNIKTVLGQIPETEMGTMLAHEHICCYNEYIYKMVGKAYMDKDELFESAVRQLKMLKEKYNLRTFIDCTPINIGRDVQLLKRVSEESGVNIICSTGFYYNDEPVLYTSSAELLSEYIISDAVNVNAGIIKCAVESENISAFNEKVLRACAKAQLKLELPIVMHTNARNKNGVKALEILLEEGVKPQAITVAHLSDTEDVEYISGFAKLGCYIGLDRIYENYSDEYINSKVKTILDLYEAGYGDKLLLSHDKLIFNGFNTEPNLNDNTKFSYCFDYILPKLPKELSEQITVKNPLNMLKMI